MKNFLLKSFAVFAMSLLLLGGVNAQAKKIAYLYDPTKALDTNTGMHPEMSVANFLTQEGYEVFMFRTPNLNNCTAEQLDTLRNWADLIIIGRGLGSPNFNSGQNAIWNTISTPVLSMNMFAVRSSTLKWFDTTSPDYGGTTPEKKVKINAPTDPVFAGITMTDDSLVIWNGLWNSLIAGPAGNEKILASFTGADAALRIVYARFDPFKDFYALGTPNAPAGYRTFLGMGGDSSGGNPYNYFGFSFDGQDIFKREVLRLINLGKPVGIKPINNVFASIYVNQTDGNIVVEMAKLKEVKIMDITGKMVNNLKVKNQDAYINSNSLKAGIYLVKAIDSNNKSVVKKVVVK